MCYTYCQWRLYAKLSLITRNNCRRINLDVAEGEIRPGLFLAVHGRSLYVFFSGVLVRLRPLLSAACRLRSCQDLICTVSVVLVFPGLVAQGCPVEFLAIVLPQRHETIHVGNEMLVVMTLEQMNHFMDNDVL